MLDRQNLCNCTAGGVANDMGTLDAERVQETNDIGRHPFDRVPEPGLITLSDTAVVEGYDFEPLAKCRDLILPKRCEPTQSGDEQDGKAHAVPLVVERAVAD